MQQTILELLERQWEADVRELAQLVFLPAQGWRAEPTKSMLTSTRRAAESLVEMRLLCRNDSFGLVRRLPVITYMDPTSFWSEANQMRDRYIRTLASWGSDGFERYSRGRERAWWLASEPFVSRARVVDELAATERALDLYSKAYES